MSPKFGQAAGYRGFQPNEAIRDDGGGSKVINEAEHGDSRLRRSLKPPGLAGKPRRTGVSNRHDSGRTAPTPSIPEASRAATMDRPRGFLRPTRPPASSPVPGRPCSARPGRHPRQKDIRRASQTARDYANTALPPVAA